MHSVRGRNGAVATCAAGRAADDTARVRTDHGEPVVDDAAPLTADATVECETFDGDGALEDAEAARF